MSSKIMPSSHQLNHKRRSQLATRSQKVGYEKIAILESRTKLLRHFGMNKNFDGESYLPQQFFPLSPLSMLLCQHKTPQSFQTTLSKGEGGGGTHICDLVCVSIQGDRETWGPIASVSTSSVQDCSLLKEGRLQRFL